VYYQPDVPLNDSRVTVTGLQPYTKYKFCVLWAVAAGRDPLEGAASHLISTLARGPPASAPLELQAAAPDCPGRHPRVGQLAAAAVPGRHARQLQAGERRPFWRSGGWGGGPRPLRPPPPLDPPLLGRAGGGPRRNCRGIEPNEVVTWGPRLISKGPQTSWGRATKQL